MAPKTTYSDAATMATTTVDHTLATLKREYYWFSRPRHSLIISSRCSKHHYTGVVYGNKNYAAIDKKIVINITLSATALVVSLIAVLISAIAVCTRKKGSMKNTLSKIKKFSKPPSHTFYNDTSAPIYNPNSSDEEGDGEAL